MILETMLQRLYASLVHGPCMNSRPHGSRQRIDLAALAALQSVEPTRILHGLLGDRRQIDIPAHTPPFPAQRLQDTQLTEEQLRNRRDWQAQQKLIEKLREVAEDAREYEQDTGENGLYLGVPLLCLPPAEQIVGGAHFSSRIVAPVALIPVDLQVKRGASPSITLRCKGEGTDLIIPNEALLAWIEQQTGRETGDLFADEIGAEPYREINELVQFACEALKLEKPAELNPETELTAAPRSDDMTGQPGMVTAAVLGLFPLSNQGLLRDTKAMLNGESVQGPVQTFLNTDALSESEPAPEIPEETERDPRVITDETLIAPADPCQVRAIGWAQRSPNLVIHGPPGTGKSQTITNIIGDHLAEGQRVLVVCDKRTALDVVKHRLDHIGLGHLCAIVHDAQRDQRRLYKSIREQLERLPEAPPLVSPETKLNQVNRQLQSLHEELTRYHEALLESAEPDQHSFHELMGAWFELRSADNSPLQDIDTTAIQWTELDSYKTWVHEILQRGCKLNYPQNPWSDKIAIALSQYLSQPLRVYQSRLSELLNAAQTADSFASDDLPPFDPELDLTEQGEDRESLARQLEQLLADLPPEWLQRWAGVPREKIQHLRQQMTQLHPFLELLAQDPVDPELEMVFRADNTELRQINQKILALEDCETVMKKWYGVFAYGKRAAAKSVLAEFGLSLDLSQLQRAHGFLEGYKARLILRDFVETNLVDPNTVSLPADADVCRCLSQHEKLFDLLEKVTTTPSLNLLQEELSRVLTQPETGSDLVRRLHQSRQRAEAVVALEPALDHCGFFAPEWLETIKRQLRQGALLAETAQAMNDRLPELEEIIRMNETRSNLPPALAKATAALLNLSIPPDDGWSILLRSALENEITRRIQEDPRLQQIDRERMQACLQHYRELDRQKRTLVAQAIQAQWQSRQQQRVVSSAGSQLNRVGTQLKQRLFLRGERAMKLRQVIQRGRDIPDGDPLFDLCPVWMASPATVAQIFAREPFFDVIIFDEASQCRLEEALPVLIRGRRIVIAGDPKQLPPTRFFETAWTESELTEPETEQDLFEQQQSGVEDLLTAALNLEVQQSYLDVHYRSRNEDLIGFSNRHFYSDRLQPIPGHPSNKTVQAPIELHHTGGTYENRCNRTEADEVCRIVRELLAQPEPPSIGIASFNLQQRDLIWERLEAMADEDPEFARQLQAARLRRGAGSFEGLFVKNLENVQGDERDHILISTTFGPDPEGKFKRYFGPLGRSGGGRRLNVLVTRAREKVHLLTSIPRGEYTHLPQLEPEQRPNGRWFLYAYLHYAEQLQTRDREQSEFAQTDLLPVQPGKVHIQPSAYESRFARELALHLADEYNARCHVHWGNDGFCVDIALLAPNESGSAPLGVLCDSTRFGKAADPVEWDLFRTAILENQGWKLHRLLTPNFFRNPEHHIEAILEEAKGNDQ